MLTNPNMTLKEFINRNGGIDLTAHQLEVIEQIQKEMDVPWDVRNEDAIEERRSIELEEEMGQRITTTMTHVETCDDCGTRFYPDGVTNYMGGVDSDDICDPFMQFVYYCSDCYAKRTPTDRPTRDGLIKDTITGEAHEPFSSSVDDYTGDG